MLVVFAVGNKGAEAEEELELRMLGSGSTATAAAARARPVECVNVHVIQHVYGAYLSSLETSVDFREDVVGSVLKALIFGVMVGIIATYRGYTSEPNAAGVSRATTSTVVIASVSILFSDYFITALWGV